MLALHTATRLGLTHTRTRHAPPLPPPPPQDDKDWGKISVTESHSSYAPADFAPYKARDSPVFCAWSKAGVKRLSGKCRPIMTVRASCGS